MDRRDYLKPLRFGNAEKRRLQENKNLKDKRSLRRTVNFNIRRDIAEIAQEIDKTLNENIPPKIDKVIDRKLALQKFRAEKEAQKKALKEKKKPPFVVGIPHHGSSPLLKELHTNQKNKKTTNSLEVRSSRVTRATTRVPQGTVTQEKPKPETKGQTRNVFKAPQSVTVFPFKNIKSKFSFLPQNVPQSGKKLTSPHTPTVLKRSVKKKPLNNLSNLVIKLKKTDDSNKLVADGILAEPLPPVAADKKIPDATIIKEETVGNKASPVIERLDVKIEADKEIITVNAENELTKQVEFQLERLESETARLLELADQWQSMVLKERLPQEVVDEVDSLVGQTRLLTSDKFQQFRRLIVEFEQQTGTHPVSLDDLNGFWDMVYLQVESLDKKYAALDQLKSNNWVKPEPVLKKKRRLTKTSKVKKTNEIENTTIENQSVSSSVQLQLLGEPSTLTPTTNMKPVINSVLSSKKRTRSYSPSPYIAMRLSGIGRTPNSLVQPVMLGRTAGDELVVDVCGTPKSSMNSWTEPKHTSSKKVKLEYDEPIVEEPLPAATPRRSMRLIAKLQTPASCSACESASCLKSSSCAKEINKSASKPKASRKTLRFSPSGSKTEKESGVAVQHKETDENKPSTSKVKFSLRPSILVVEDKDPADVHKRASKRRQTLFTADSVAAMDQDTENLAPTCRRSTRRSKKVQFESGLEEKENFKLPATPFRKSQADL